MTGKALLIVHQKTSDPGRIGRLLREGGFVLDVRCPNIGDPLPETLDAHDAVVIFGGPMSANDGHVYADEKLEKWESDTRKAINQANQQEKDSSKHYADFKLLKKEKVKVEVGS